MRGLRIPLSGYALPAVAPRKKHERKPRTRQSVPGDPACAQTNHASDHVATPPRCQLTKIQLLVLLKPPLDPCARFLFSLARANSFRRPESRMRFRRMRDDIVRCGYILLPGWRSTTLMLFLAPVASGPEVTRDITGGDTGSRVSRLANNEKRLIIRVRDFNAAAKMERAVSAGRIASCGACLLYCRYSADTLHPSPEILDKNDL